ncbi:MAG TPA: FAH family protein, partial [Asticcacaulis sp.]|nr:FAH family protein [Asticcacaulis sp.]
LWLAHSKLRPASLGVEILTGELPNHIQGTSRIWRGNEVIWEKPFISGEDNMSHTIANLEHHHFKYGLFRQPGDVHVHCFGTATASFADGVKTKDGDVFEITAEPFEFGLRNPVRVSSAETVTLKTL